MVSESPPSGSAGLSRHGSTSSVSTNTRRNPLRSFFARGSSSLSLSSSAGGDHPAYTTVDPFAPTRPTTRIVLPFPDPNNFKKLPFELAAKRAVCIEVLETDSHAGFSFGHSGPLSQRTFVLLRRALLRYPVKSSPHSLPEGVILLSPGAVAYASDDIEGRQYVLRVAERPRRTHDDSPVSPTAAPPPHSSGIGLHFFHDDRPKSFLLVFETSTDFMRWLGLVRDQIRGNGIEKHNREDSTVFFGSLDPVTSPLGGDIETESLVRAMSSTTLSSVGGLKPADPRSFFTNAIHTSSTPSLSSSSSSSSAQDEKPKRAPPARRESMTISPSPGARLQVSIQRAKIDARRSRSASEASAPEPEPNAITSPTFYIGSEPSPQLPPQLPQQPPDPSSSHSSMTGSTDRGRRTKIVVRSPVGPPPAGPLPPVPSA
ncbi:uncharacterized protein V2V93DRAFT_368903 [Kockiozyma suomiensis]|uniref:uncharacterized protein n=1 Tax=Kockiozyma suomiensis TaxID=1337062 RepID=UPI003344380C